MYLLGPCWFLERGSSILDLVFRKTCLCNKEESEWEIIGVVGFDGV